MATSTSPSPSLLLPLPSSPATPSTTSNPAPTTSPAPPPTTVAPPTTSSPTSTPATSSPTTAPTSPTTAATSSASSTTSSTTSASQIVPTSSGQPVTTVTSFVGASTTPTSTPQNHSTSNSFFSNKGAVAGVFAVVGLIVVALVVALIINAIRRRRAQKFDRDVAEAAAEAAMSSRSPFDDYSYGNNGANSTGGYGYSENNHGAYQQPPLPSQDNYGMSEMSRYDPYAAAPPSLAAAAVGRPSSRGETASGRAGLAGVGAGNLAREPSKHAPYHAFAGPGPQPHELRGNTMRSRRGDVLEAAGLADTGAATMATNNYNNEAFLARKPSEYTQNTHNSGRSQGHGSMSNHPAIMQPGYPIDSSYPQRNDTHSPESFVGYQPAQSAFPNPHDAILPSPSLPGHQSDHTFGDHEDYHDAGSPTALRSDEQRMSYQDDADYSQGNRVLRVANE